MKTASFGSIAAIVWWVFAWSTASSCATAKTATTTAAATTLPHIVMIVIDDLGSHDLGLHGTGIHTPNIDGFLSADGGGNGIYLDEYYVLPYCSPTRAALLSGMYPLRTGVHNVIEFVSTAGLPLDVETLPELLRRASYRRRAVGKWHLGHAAWNQTPTFRGFESFFGYYTGSEGYFSHKFGDATDLHSDRRPNCGKDCSEVVDERGNYSTHVFTREAIEIVKDHAHRNEKEPLFLYLAYQAVHCPNEVPDRYVERYRNRTDWTDKRKTYAGMLTAADEGVGNLTRALRESGLWDDTLVIVTTDNGGPTTVGCPQGSSNGPKRGGKCTVWEGGTTGDALLAGPALDALLSRHSGGGKPEDSAASATADLRQRDRFPFLFHVVDWFPTLAEWVGVVPANRTELDGVSQVGALAQRRIPARTELFGGYAYWHTDASNGRWWGPSLRHLDWKIVQGASGGPDADDPMPDGTTAIVPPGAAEAAKGNYLLFDLSEDPGETTDLSGVYPDILSKMVYRLELYRESFVGPQANDDKACPFPGFANTTVGPAWIPWCDGYKDETLEAASE